MGIPTAGQLVRAWANASWTSSSAVSMSRTIRSTEATTRAYSKRNASVMRAWKAASGVCPWALDPTSRHATRNYISQTGTTSMKPPSMRGIFFPHSTASSFVAASIR
jgi:hypothetical protein